MTRPVYAFSLDLITNKKSCVEQYKWAVISADTSKMFVPLQNNRKIRSNHWVFALKFMGKLLVHTQWKFELQNFEIFINIF